MKKAILPDLLKKYLRGETTPAESAMVDEWYLSLQENPDDISLLDPLEADLTGNRILDVIKSKIEIPEKAKLRSTTSNSFFIRTPFKLAAAITAIAVIGLGAILFNEKGLPSLDVKTVTYNAQEKKEFNNSKFTNRVVLEDGTVIKLKPNSSIEYPEKFSDTDRRVTLKGEAFFDVTKDKNRPFIITTSELTVRVLGTSFNVMAYEGAKEISVAVKTGKESVVKSKDDVTSQPALSEVILTPNQEVIYNTTQENFSKKLVAQPQLILEKPTLFATQYDGAPVNKILAALEQNYGIDIQYDEQALSNCILTTSLAEEGLYERIEIICKAIGAQFELDDTRIVIKSNGCR